MTAVIALLFDIETLVEFLSIGTLLAYSIVSACVIILRYQPTKYSEDEVFDNGSDFPFNAERLFKGGKLKVSLPMQQWLDAQPPGHSVFYGVTAMVFGFFTFALCLSSGHIHESGGFLAAFLSASIALGAFFFICLHHQNSADLAFKVRKAIFYNFFQVPLVPLVPAVSLMINILMMLHLAPITWIRLAVWLTIGLYYNISKDTESFRTRNLFLVWNPP